MIKKILLLTALAVMSMTAAPSYQSMTNPNDSAIHWAQAQVVKMTTDEKIGQLFMLAVWSEWDEANMNVIYRDARKFHIGGVCFFAGEAAQQIAITNKLNAAAKLPLLIGIDGEWGAGMRVTDAHSFPYAMNVGAVADNDLVSEMGRQIGEHCDRLGVHINFAPVHDLNSNALNPVINYRSYGSGLDNVSAKTAAYINGMQSAGVLGVAKHFPGHGDTNTDSHHALPTINKTRQQFEEQELVPFRNAIDNGLQALMMGHLNVPALDNNNLPASLSPSIIQGLVKEEMGFEGLIISDALNMKAVAEGYENHYLKAFVAGIDVLLFPDDLGKGFSQIKRGLEQGVISMDQLDERCARVLAYKYALGAHEFTPLSLDNLKEAIDPIASQVLSQKLLTQSITLVRNEEDMLPFKNLEKSKIAAVSINNSNGNAFLDQVQDYAGVDVFNVKVSNAEDVTRLVNKMSDYDQVIVGLHGSQKKRSGNYGISSYAMDFVYRLSQTKQVAAVVMANPYAVRKMPQASYEHLQSLVFAYGNESAIQRLAAQALFGGNAMNGVLPLTINDYLTEGLSITTPCFRLGYTAIPEEVGMCSDKLDEIAVIAQEVVDEKMSPGCQVLVARKGKVVYNRAFGQTSYKNGQVLNTRHLYDIASVTKVSVTTPLIMQMEDEGLLDIKMPIQLYLPELFETDKAMLTLEEMMLHQAGLCSYIAFDFNLIDEEKLQGDLFHRCKTSIYTIPITKNLYMNNTFQLKDGYLSDQKSDEYDVKVADGVYVSHKYRDEMFHMMDTLPLSDSKKYKYSDLGFYYAMRTVEANSSLGIDELVAEQLHGPLGMNYTCYNPLNRYSKEDIVPTVDEVFFRNQLLQGYVHDQGAALMGGVGGHAGVFSNANDLAKLMQMYLNEGSYGGDTLIDSETVRYFTQHTANGFRRGVGFDKPEGVKDRPQPTCEAAPLSAFGHTGFTGTCVWADPENELIFIFLSNRVHPDTYNSKLYQEDIRPRIQAIIYDAILD